MAEISPMAHSEYLARNHRGARSEAVAATRIEYSKHSLLKKFELIVSQSIILSNCLQVLEGKNDFKK